MANRNWNDALDDMLEKLNNGSFATQSVNEFVKTVNKATGNTTTRKTTKAQKVVKPHVNQTVERAKYESRYQQVKSCLAAIIYDTYPEEKKVGYQQCVERFQKEVETHSSNLKTVDQQVLDDMSEYKKRVKENTTDDFLVGYYDGLLMVRKILYNSQLARLKILAGKVTNNG